MKRYPVQGNGDIENRQTIPFQWNVMDFQPSEQMSGPFGGDQFTHPIWALVQAIIASRERNNKPAKLLTQYFNPNTPLGKLQESFGVEPPFYSPYFTSRME